MKKFIIALTALLTFAASANAMSYEQARQQALFLTDKMAYELNLTEEQYEAAYEINLDYLMNISNREDLYGIYWEHRNLDLSYILLDWQYRAYVEATYFYRPLYWDAGYWHFGIYARYPHRNYFYFGRPHFYAVYRGGHSWRMNGGRSWYHGRDWGPRPGHSHSGMRDGFQRGDFGRGTHFNQNNGRFNNNPNSANNNRSFGSSANRGTQRQNTHIGSNSSFGSGSSTHATATKPRTSVGTTTPRSTFTPSRSSSSNSSFGSSSRGSSSFGSSSRGSSSFGSSSRSNSSFGSGSRGSSSFGSSSRGGSSFGSGSRGGSFSSGARSTGGSHSSGSSAFGGKR